MKKLIFMLISIFMYLVMICCIPLHYFMRIYQKYLIKSLEYKDQMEK